MLFSNLFLTLELKAIQRSNAAAITVTNLSDIPSDLVNPGAVELVLEIRKEYARRLEEVIFPFLSILVDGVWLTFLCLLMVIT